MYAAVVVAIDVDLDVFVAAVIVVVVAANVADGNTAAVAVIANVVLQIY